MVCEVLGGLQYEQKNSAHVTFITNGSMYLSDQKHGTIIL